MRNESRSTGGGIAAVGVEAARVALCHQSVAVTEIYAEPDRALARCVALEVGQDYEVFVIPS